MSFLVVSLCDTWSSVWRVFEIVPDKLGTNSKLDHFQSMEGFGYHHGQWLGGGNYLRNVVAWMSPQWPKAIYYGSHNLFTFKWWEWNVIGCNMSSHTICNKTIHNAKSNASTSMINNFSRSTWTKVGEYKCFASSYKMPQMHLMSIL